MNPMHTLHLWKLRHHRALRRCAWLLLAAVLGALTGYGAWWSMTRYVEADARIRAAQENERLALALLNGEVQEIERAGKYAKVITYERKERIVEEVR